MSTKRCYYETLEVDRNADESKLKSAFRKLAMKWHPDKNPGDATSEVKFKEINEAYEVLKDGEKRAAYDRYGHAAFEQGMGGGGPGFGAGFASSFSDIFEDLFGMAGQRGRGGGRERGADLRYNMEITLEEAYLGKTAQIEIPVSVTCEPCSGTGAKASTNPKTCSMGGGAGHPRVLPARRRRSALPGSNLDGRRCARRRIRGPDHRQGQDQGESAGRDAVRPPFPHCIKRHAGAPLAPDRRHVCPGHGRNAAESDQEAAGIARRVRKIVVRRHPAGSGGLLHQGQGLLRQPHGLLTPRAREP